MAFPWGSGNGIAAAGSPATRGIIPLDRVVAVVNEEVITLREMEERIKLASQRLAKQNTPLPPRDALERQILDRLINDRVQLQFAKDTGVRVDDTQLERALARVAEDNNLSLTAFREALERDGIPFPKFREEIRNEIILARLKDREVDSKILVTDAEIEQFLKNQGAEGSPREEFRLGHILVQLPEAASPEQIQGLRRRAEEALTQIKQGASFAQVAAAFSNAPDALQGGVMDWRPADRLPDIFLEALKSMNLGDVSEILRSPNGFHLIKLLEKRGRDAPFLVRQTRARHILMKTNDLLSEADVKTRLLGIKERIENGEPFAELARRYSEDASAPQGGELGWLSPNDTVPEFEQAMEALAPGKLSDPIKTPFGWHLIQVEERRNQDLSKERRQLTARQAIRARKSDEAYQEWVRQLRDRSFVEIRLEER